MASSTLNSNRVIVVDDTSTDIQYPTGSWFLDTSGSQDSKGNFGPVYNATLHGVKQGPASLVYTFTGSQIEVLGTNDIQDNLGILNPSWECFVDGDRISVNPFKWPENNWILCDSPQLPDGTHVLTVNASVDSPETFWIDQIRYIPSSESQLTTTTVYINSTDAVIQSAFGEGWVKSVESSNLTAVHGSIFTLDFTGVALSWYGLIPENTPLVSTTGSYTVDGSGDSHDFFIEALADANGDTTYNAKYFETPRLPAGNHQLVVTYNGNSLTTPLTLDYLIIQKASVSLTLSSSNPPSTAVGSLLQKPSTPSHSLSPSSGMSLSGGGSGDVTSTLTTSTTFSHPNSTSIAGGGGPTSVSSGNGRKQPNVTDIAGLTSSGLGILLLAAILFVLVRRVRKSRKTANGVQNVIPTPFQYSPALDTRFRADGTKIHHSMI